MGTANFFNNNYGIPTENLANENESINRAFLISRENSGYSSI